MEWIETTAKSLEEAKELALDKLGVDGNEAEFEVLEEPRQGLFGRVRGEARVRARVQPKTPRSKDESKRRRKPRKSEATEAPIVDNEISAAPAEKSARKPAARKRTAAPTGPAPSSSGTSDSEPAAAETESDSSQARTEGSTNTRQRKASSRPSQEESSVEEVTNTVETFLAGLTEAFGIDASVKVRVEDGQLFAAIEGKHGLLLGPKAHTLDAIQELTRVTAQRAAPSATRIRVDVGGYREARRLALAGFAEAAATRAIDEGVEVVLEPMNAADRKTVHDTINEISGAVTRSAGTEPRRRVIVGPDASPVSKDEEE